MDLNPVKKVKIANSSASEPPENVDALENPGKKMISKLNHDCLAKVFMCTSILDRLEMENVCQKWREATELSWYNVKKLNLDLLMIRLDKNKEISEKIMRRCCRFLTHLTISDKHYLWLADILEDNCHKMVHFDVEVEEGGQIPDDELVYIIESMSKLKYLRVSVDNSDNWDSVLLDEILEVLPRDIEEIHLIETEGWHLRLEVPLGEFHNLRCLTLQKICLRNETLESLIPSQNTLTHLDLTWCEFPSGDLQALSNFKNLEQLILLHVMDFNVNAITLIAHNCSKLKHLQFTRMADEYQVFPYQIFRELRYLNLEYLECDEVAGSQDKIYGLGDNWRNLKHLDVCGGSYFSLLDFQEITKFKNLEYLNVYNAANFNSESFINITNNCQALKEIFMSFRNISETAIENFANLKQLKKLNFTYDYMKLTGNLLSTIVNNCKNLIDLNISSCKNLTEASLVEVGKLTHLNVLDVSGIENVPNEMFDNLCKLYSLTCDGCPSVTDEGIMKVIENCEILQYLYVKGTGVTAKSLIHALNREFVFMKLQIHVDEHVKHAYKKINRTSPFLEIC